MKTKIYPTKQLFEEPDIKHLFCPECHTITTFSFISGAGEESIYSCEVCSTDKLVDKDGKGWNHIILSYDGKA